MKTKSKRLHKAKQREFVQDEALEYSSVQKAINILLAFVPENKTMGNSELSESLGLSKSTISRLTHILALFGLLKQDEKTQKYELGKTCALLGKGVEITQNEQLARLGRPYIDHLRDAVGESVCLEVLGPSGHVKLIGGAVGPPPISVTFPKSILTHTAAGAKVILAYSGLELSHPDFKLLNEQIEEIREHGVAYDHGEANAEVHTVSVAVFNRSKKPVAAISICVPATRVRKILDSKNVNLLKTTARKISSRCPIGLV